MSDSEEATSSLCIGANARRLCTATRLLRYARNDKIFIKRTKNHVIAISFSKEATS